MTQNNNLNYQPVQFNTLVGDANSNITNVSTGTSGQVLTSNGAAAQPTYQNPSQQGVVQTSIKITTYNVADSPATWSKDAKTKWIKAWIFAGGGGGGSGAKLTSGSSGGGGGGGGGYVAFISAPASSFNTTETVTIGSGGAGGNAVTVNGNNGNNGIVGNDSIFGSVRAKGGGAGNLGFNGNAGAVNGGRSINPFITNNFASFSDSGTGTITNGIQGPAGTGTALSQTTSGGGGGGGSASTAFSGSKGDDLQDPSGTILLNGGAGGIETGTINGSDGNVPLTSGGLWSGGTGGGGGGGAKTVGSAGKGGNGAIPGGGGGGGGGGITGVANSGAGGNGGDGRVIIWEFF